MKTVGINAIDVVVHDLSVTAEYLTVFGFTDCGADNDGHMTKVGDFHIYFRQGQAKAGYSFVPVLRAESTRAMRQHFVDAGYTPSELQVFSDAEFMMFEVQDRSGNRLVIRRSLGPIGSVLSVSCFAVYFMR